MKTVSSTSNAEDVESVRWEDSDEYREFSSLSAQLHQKATIEDFYNFSNAYFLFGISHARTFVERRLSSSNSDFCLESFLESLPRISESNAELYNDSLTFFRSIAETLPRGKPAHLSTDDVAPHIKSLEGGIEYFLGWSYKVFEELNAKSRKRDESKKGYVFDEDMMWGFSLASALEIVGNYRQSLNDKTPVNITPVSASQIVYLLERLKCVGGSRS